MPTLGEAKTIQWNNIKVGGNRHGRARSGPFGRAPDGARLSPVYPYPKPKPSAPCLAFNDPYSVHRTLKWFATMSTSHVLQHLYALDTSSPDFWRYLYCLIQNDENEQYLSKLQGSELIRLVDFLDETCAFSGPFPGTKPTARTSDVVSIDGDVVRRCLHTLRGICSHNAILPSSYTITGHLVRVGDVAVTFGGFSEIWEGTYNSSNVCIKLLRFTGQTRKAVEEVSIRYRLISCRLKGAYHKTGFLQGGDNVEKA